MKLTKLTLADIRALSPCYDPVQYLPENWRGTVVDILETKDCPVEDRMWVAMHFLPDPINRHFAVLVAQRALDEFYPESTDSYAACMIAELMALGVDVPDEERVAAWAPAWDAARAAAWAAAWAAARVAARDAAWDEQIKHNLRRRTVTG